MAKSVVLVESVGHMKTNIKSMMPRPYCAEGVRHALPNVSQTKETQRIQHKTMAKHNTLINRFILAKRAKPINKS